MAADLKAVGEEVVAPFELDYKKCRVADSLSGLEEIARYGEESERAIHRKNSNFKYTLREYAKWPELSRKHAQALEARGLVELAQEVIETAWVELRLSEEGQAAIVDEYADTVISVLDQMNIKKAVFGGLSMGSGIALNIAML